MAKVENEPIKKIVVKKPVTKKKVFASVKEKETTASKNWQRDRHTDEKIAHHVSKLESEFHHKLRLMEEKYNTSMTGLEKRTRELETANEKQESVIMELLKRIHTTHKEDKTELLEKIEKLEVDIEKATSSHKATNKVLDKTMAKADARISSHKKEMTNLMYRVDNLDRRIDNRIQDHSHDDHYGNRRRHYSEDEYEASDSSISPMKIFPFETISNPAISLKVVVFPHPEGPRRVINCPGSILKFSSRTALTCPKDLLTS